MSGIKKGSLLTCSDLFVMFYDYCQEPPVMRDPYEVYYSISICDSYCGDNILNETIDADPLRESVGKYYVPQLPSDLETGKYKVRWKFKETEDCTFKEICMEFVLYTLGDCRPIQTFPNSCICFNK